MAILKLSWLGVPGVEIDGHPLRLEMRKALALLAYLSLSPHGQTRETLACLFWPGFDQQHALASLRRSLFSLGKSLPAGVLEADRETIGLRKDAPIRVDIEEFKELAAQPKAHGHSSNQVCSDCLPALEEAVFSYQGDFLKGFNLKDCPAFDEWQFFQRESLRNEYAGALQRLAAHFQSQRNWDKAIDYAQRWVASDPLNETAQRKLIDLYGQSGRRNLALQQFKTLQKFLKDELDQVPEAETLSLYETLLPVDGPGSLEGELAVSTSTAWKAEPLIKTKLFIPPLRKDLVARSRLLDLLDSATKLPVTLVSAPAGFGKTTLLTSWTGRTELPIAWFSIDEGDNDPLRFTTYLIAALESALPAELCGHFQGFSQPLQPSIRPALVQLINLLATQRDPFVLILDDYQFIHSRAIHEGLEFLLEKIPTCMHLIIATRNDPPFSLALLRGRNQLAEIRMNDLRFVLEESADFIQRVMSIQLTSDDIAALETRTEGWIAGLQMAALAIRSLVPHLNEISIVKDREQAISRFIQAFSGSHRYILDYLGEEVLDHQAQRTRNFLLQTSILERFSGQLCDAVTGMEDSQKVIEELEKENLFLMPLDSERHWYRYHHLFAELLQFRLMEALSKDSKAEMEGFASLEELHRRAAEWFETAGLFEEAIRHFLLAKRYDHASTLILSRAHSMLFNTGQSFTLTEWLSELPEDLYRSEPGLAVLKAWTLLAQNQFAAALEQAETSWLAIRERKGEDTPGLVGEIALIRGVLAELSNRDVTVMRQQALLALDELPDKDLSLRCLAAWLLAESYLWDGDARNAEESFLQAIPLCREAGNIYITLVSIADLSEAVWEQGRFREALKLLLRAQQEMTLDGHWEHPRLGQLYVDSAHMLLQWNRLDEAERAFNFGIELAERDTPQEIFYLGLSVMPYIKHAQGKQEEAFRLACECLDRVEAYPLPYLPSAIRSNLNHLWILLNDQEHLDQWLNGCGLEPNGRVDFRNEGQYTSLAEVLLFHGRVKEALKILSRLRSFISKDSRNGRLFRVLLLQAMAYKQLNNLDRALEALGHSLRLVKSEGLIRPFVDAGEPMRELLQLGFKGDLWRQIEVEGFARQLLQAF